MYGTREYDKAASISRPAWRLIRVLAGLTSSRRLQRSGLLVKPAIAANRLLHAKARSTPAQNATKVLDMCGQVQTLKGPNVCYVYIWFCTSAENLARLGIIGDDCIQRAVCAERQIYGIALDCNRSAAVDPLS